MRIRTVLLLAMAVAAPSAALADSVTDIVKIFGRDPGTDAAHACFIRHYTKAHLASHPKQNVTDMVLFVNKQKDDVSYYSLTMQVNFRQLRKPFQVAGSCDRAEDGKHALNCGVDCDGGAIAVRVKNEMSLLIDIPDSVRVYDPSVNSEETDEDLPKGARFGEDDKLFRLDRTALRDCMPVISDEEMKAKVSQGLVTQ